MDRARRGGSGVAEPRSSRGRPVPAVDQSLVPADPRDSVVPSEDQLVADVWIEPRVELLHRGATRNEWHPDVASVSEPDADRLDALAEELQRPRPRGVDEHPCGTPCAVQVLAADREL